MNLSYQQYTLTGLCNNQSLKTIITHDEFCKNMTKLLKIHKAIHLKPIHHNNLLDAEYFAQHTIDCKLKKFKYIGGAATRKIISVSQDKDIIFTANEAPPDKLIPFHHELAQTSSPPAYVSFFCKNPSTKNGETPILDSNLIYRYLHKKYPEIEEKFKKYGVRYKRTLPLENDLDSPIGRSWKETYQVNNKKDLEYELSKINGLEYFWNQEEELTTITEILPAIYFNNESNQFIFHNSIIAAFIGWDDIRNNRRESIMYGNKQPIETEVLEDIAKQMEKMSVEWKWEQGDIIWIDNRQALHARNNYSGNRQIYASLWNRSLYENQDPGIKGIYRTNLQLPQTFGFWKVSNQLCENITYQAISNGYRRLDSACDYGNEYFVGLGIKKAIQNKICQRSDLYITSKLWNTFHHPDHVELACRKTLQDLQLTYLDCYLIHFPISLEYIPLDKKYPPEWTNLEGQMILKEHDLNQTWFAMEKLVSRGLVKNIGISNFNSALLRQIINISTIKPSQLQIEVHPYLTQEKMIKLAQDNNIEVNVFSPLGAKSYLELNMAENYQDLTNHSLILELSQKYQKTPVQILLRWSIQKNLIPICKSNSLNHMIENIDLYDFSIDNLDIESISRLNKNLRFNDPGVFCLEAFGTFCPIYD